ncbi:hypothetical protein YSY43_31220 [Paenibacillus sp. YSY-4.3]
MEAARYPAEEACYLMEVARYPMEEAYLPVQAYCKAAAVPSLALAAYYAAKVGHRVVQH